MNCQKCRAPLQLHPSLQDLDPGAFDLLIGSSKAHGETETGSKNGGQHRRHSSHDAPPLVKINSRSIRRGIGPHAPKAGPSEAKEAIGMSFVILSDSPLGSTNANQEAIPVESSRPTEQVRRKSILDDPQALMSQKVDYSARFFEALSARSEIDHPLCTECTDILLVSLQARLSAASKERDAYTGFLRELNNHVPTEAELAQARQDLAAAEVEEQQDFARLVGMEREKARLQDELEDLNAGSRELDTKEEEFWRSRNAFALEQADLENRRAAMKIGLEHDVRQLERLQKTNVYNDLFCISHDGHFGTINGLRLGRLAPPNHVEWAEINAAWGDTALLLDTVANVLSYSFRGYRIAYLGSTSRIERFEYSQTPSIANPSVTSRPTARAGNPEHAAVIKLELFSSGDLPLGRTILHRKFNEAMVAFLECVRQLGQFVEHGEWVSRTPHASGMKLPYTIDKDKIGGLSIKLGVSQDEAWTTACKYTLTCCKFLLANASNVAGATGRGR